MRSGWAIIFSNASPLCPMLLWSSSPLWVIYSSFSLSALVFLSCFSQALCSELAGLPIVWTLGVCILLNCSTGFGGSPLSTAVEVQGTWQPPLRSEVTVSSVKPFGDPQRYAYFTLCHIQETVCLAENSQPLRAERDRAMNGTTLQPRGWGTSVLVEAKLKGHLTNCA